LKTAFIINPGSGGKRKDRLRKALADRIAQMFPDAPVTFSTTADEASTRTRELLEGGCECIAVAGGDGTINSVLQGFFRDDRGTPVRKGAALGVIPVGTGGDFRRTLGIENDPLAALSLLSGDSVKPCDVGLVEYTDAGGKKAKRYFLNITSFGLSGLVDKYVLESSKKLGGTLTFFLATLKAFRRYTNTKVEVTIDGSTKKTLTSVLVAVANGRFFGSGMHIAPMADIGDGLLDVVVLGDMHLGDFIRHGSKLYAGKLTNHPDFFHARARSVGIVPVEETGVMTMDMDGEPLGTTPASVTIVPSAIALKI